MHEKLTGPGHRLHRTRVSLRGFCAGVLNFLVLGCVATALAGEKPSAKPATFDLEKRRAAHWAWQPIRPVIPPKVRQPAWPANDVDRFILSKLEASGLKPAPAAEKRTLLRRVHFDLTGLPPTPAEVEAFLGDSSTNAFEQVVDKLLQSPQFGERWARHWLDLVCYSETLGHEFDFANMNAWRYRDYVIRAFNEDVPYNQFILEHLAGDLLEQPRRHLVEGFNESVIGTGFYWMGQRVHSPVDIRLEQAEVVDAQIDALAKTFLGLTVACARCHDHKFDAISTRDYYSLFGVLASSRYTQASIAPVEPLTQCYGELSQQKDALRQLIGAVWLEEASTSGSYLIALAGLGPVEPVLEFSNRVRSVASSRQLDPSRLESWFRLLSDPVLAHPGQPLAAWSKLTHSPAPESVAFAESWQIFLKELRSGAPVTLRTNSGDLGDFSGADFGGWYVEDEAFGKGPGKAGSFVVGEASQPVLTFLAEPAASSGSASRRFQGALRSPTFVITNRFVHIRAAGSGTRLNVRVDNFTMIRDPLYGGLRRNVDQPELQWLTVDLGPWKGHRAYLEFNDFTTPDPGEDNAFGDDAYVAISRVVLSEDGAPPGAPEQGVIPSTEELAGIASPEQLAKACQEASVGAVKAWLGERATPQQVALIERLHRRGLLEATKAGSPNQQSLARALEAFRKAETSMPGRLRVLAMADGNGVDEKVFIRGNHKSTGELVPRRFLAALGGSDQRPFTQGSGRLEMARQMVDPANPFPPRVMVNRVWQHLFGSGIVATPDDFGVLGQAPTHPELLDWLADWYRTGAGWSNRKLIRLLVTSRAYRMSSRPADSVAEEKDPQNLLLHRMPVRRLESEPLRDAMLAVSGQLNTAMFGPPVPVHLTEFMDGRGRPGQSGPLDGAGRRSIYQEVRRNFLPPMMRAFDCPMPFRTIGRRTASNVPAQSLILMNDPFVAGQAQAWAKAVLARSGLSPEQRITELYETSLSRPPEPSELAAGLAFLERQGQAHSGPGPQCSPGQAAWADLCHVLLNLKEFVFLD